MAEAPPPVPFLDLGAGYRELRSELDAAADRVLASGWYVLGDEVAAFEELIGSHGGLGGFQTRPFIMHPADWTIDEPIVGYGPFVMNSEAEIRQAFDDFNSGRFG